ncbi:hypothetical protein A9Q99_04275 [Gammaproteobacteria bacterium 45_16_T64]|nr:hypothetical protein A9Q99_04275 [Gammaproteobacteria bacterium 45_16_T64]
MSDKQLLKRLASLSPEKRELLLKQLQQKKSKSAQPRIDSIQRYPREDNRLPMSYAQQRLWFLEQLQSGTSSYNISAALKLKGNLDIEALRLAFEEIVVRHEALRTTFIAEDGQGRQVIMEPQRWELPTISLEPLTTEEQDDVIKTRFIGDAQTSFDLVNGPLLRTRLIRLAQDGYVLIVTMHHIVADGWSMGVLIKELAALYEAFAQDQSSPLEPLKIQYGDFSQWQREWLSGDRLNKQLSYWKEHLVDVPVLALPTDFSRPPIQTYDGANSLFVIDKDTTASLNALCKAQGVTLFMTLLASLQVLLHRYSGQDDICVGTPIANRVRPELEGLIGCFVNTLAIRNDLSGNPTFTSLLSQVQKNLTGAYDHQDIPFERLVDELGVAREMSHTPLFQVMFVLQNAAPTNSLALKGVNIELMPEESNTAKFDLTLNLREEDGCIVGDWEYRTDLFEPRTIERMKSHFMEVLRSVVNEPSRNIDEISLLAADEKQMLLEQWNDTAREYERDSNIATVFSKQVALFGDNNAVSFGERSVTYKQLNNFANEIAQKLIEKNVRATQRVGICSERSIELLASILGILKVGAAYVPLDPSYPQDRLHFMLEDSSADIVIVQQHLREQMPVKDSQVLLIESFAQESEKLWPEVLVHVDAEDPAYVMYTSGSTGKPKGIEVVQRNVIRLVRNTDFMTLNSDVIFLQYAPISFDAATLEIWGPLLNGGCLAVAPAGQLNPEEIGAVIQQHSVNAAWLTAALFHFIAEYHVDQFAGVTQLLAGGDVLSPALVRKVLDRFDDVCLINGYGPTENTTFTCCYPMHHPSQVRQTVPIGRPIANTRIYILDSALSPVPVGVPGELYTSGDGVANGYLNRDDLTNEVFLPNPFDKGGDPVMYKTGDLVRYCSDSSVEYLGRIDQQVKIRGYRIELGEIEDAISQINTTREVAVIAREDTPGVKKLAAYIVPQEGFEPKASELRTELKSSLPEYMVPSFFVMMERFPVTANGKLDRKALPKPEAEASISSDSVPPRNDKEESLASIWRDVLSIDNVGVFDNFFELGGDSILSIQIISRAKLTGLHLTTKQVFENQTIAELAVVASEVEAPIMAEQGVVVGDVPLSPIEQWFFDHEFTEESHWNQSVLLDLKPEFVHTESQIAEAMAAVVLHHDALRLRFERIDGMIRQFHQPGTDGYAHFALHDVDLTRCDSDRLREEIAAEANGIQSSLNLSKGPLLAVGIFRLPEGQRKMLLVVHHLVVDGVSWRILLDDISAALVAVSDKKTVNFAPKTTSYQQWVEALAEYANGSLADSETEYWKAQVKDSKPLLPIDNPSGSKAVANTKVHQVTLPSGLTSSLLRDVSQAYKTEINDILLTALAKTISDWSGHSEVLIDLEGHGRESFNDRIDLSRTFGWFTSVYPVRLGIEAGLPLASNIKRIKEQLREIPNKGFGFGALKTLSNDAELRGVLSDAPKADIVFNYLGQFDSMLENSPWFALASDDKGSEHSADGDEPHLLSVNCHIVDGCLQIDWIFSDDIYRNETIESIANNYLFNLTQIIEHCLDDAAYGYTPSDFPLADLDQPEVDRLFATESGIESAYPLSPMQEGMLFHSLFDTGSGVYFEQLSVEVIGGVDREVLQKSWAYVLNRHPVLRSAFLWDDLDSPLQVVYKAFDAEISDFDWTDLDADKVEHRLELWLEQDRNRGFDFSKPGLSRLAWIDLPNNKSRLVWSFHHVVLDGWSLPLVMGEVFQVYAAFAQGQQPQLGLPGRYEDFIGWLKDFDKADALQFWKNYLHGFEAPTPLAGKKVGTEKEVYFDRELTFSEDFTSKLQQYARDQHITLNTVIQAGWGVLLSRYSGEEDVVFGTTVSGRPADLTGVENIVGLFINTLPLRMRITDATCIGPLLQKMQDEQLDLRRFEATPLVDIHHNSEVPGDQSLFDSILVFENYPVGDAVKSGDQLLDIGHVTSIEHTNFPLTLIVEPASSLGLKISYDASMFEGAFIDRMLCHLEVIIRGALEQPDVPLVRMPLLSEEEKQKTLIEWNPEPAPYPKDKCLHELFEQQVLAAPEAKAIIFGSRELTYSELNANANKLARVLIAKGVKSESFVAIALDRSVEMVIAILATLKAGGAYVPLDPAYPEERLAFMLEDTQAPVLVTRAEYQAVLKPITDTIDMSLNTVLVDEDADYINEQFDSNLDQPIFGDAKRLVYVVYTSGSTGKPKGVVCHQLAVNRLVLESNYVSIRPKDQVAHLSNVSFDASTFEIWGALLNGATLVGYTKDMLLTPEEFVAEVDRTGTNIMFITTALFNVFAINYPHVFEKIKYLMFGGEACDPQQVRKIAQHHKPEHFLHVYGPSENTTFSTWYEINDVPEGALTVPIGRSLSGSTAYILDSRMQPVPVGVAGEIYVGGDGLANEYLNDIEKTNAAFIPGAFAWEGDSRLYKTGDLAKFTEAGYIEILGRADDQVKIRGFRIELGEVEASLTQLPEVIEAVVVVREDVPGQKRLVAYVIGEAGLDATRVRKETSKHLPKHMMPSSFVVMDEFPLTQNGKVNKRALPEPSADDQPKQEYVAARNHNESVLVAIWEQVLKADTVGIYDNFFELGGDSILSIQIISRAKREGLHLTAKQVFESQTIAELAEVAKDLGALIIAEQGLVEGEAVLTPVQQWFFQQQLADAHHFNQSVMFSVDATVENQQLQEAWEGVLLQHDALRLLYSQAPAGEWVQSFRPSEHIESLLDQVYEVVDLSQLPSGAQTEQLEALAAQVQAEMNLSRGPLIKVIVFNLGAEQDSRMFVVVHHLVIDVFSWRVILEDLQTALSQCMEGQSVALGDKTTSFQQWGQALSEFAQSDAVTQDAEYWREKRLVSVAEVPRDSNGLNTVASVQSIEMSLTEDETQQLLTKAPQCYRTEINELLLAAFGQTISNWTENDTVLVDLEGHGREHIADNVDISRTVGWFTSIFPLILDGVGSGDTGETIKSVKEQLRAMPRKGLGYGVLRYLSDNGDLVNDLTMLPKAQMSFNYLGQLDQVLEEKALISRAEESVGEEISQASERGYLLEVSGRIQGGKLLMTWRYSTAAHHAKTIQHIAQEYLANLRNVVEHCGNPENGAYTPSDFPLANLSQSQLYDLVPETQGIEAIYPLSPVQEGMLFHSLYEPDSWVYFDQVDVSLGGVVDEDVLFEAWRQVIARHQILRTGFIWDGVDQPLQVVHESIDLSITKYDWSSFSAEEAKAKLERYLIDDRNLGFNFKQPGILRITWVSMPGDRYQLIWSFHHILLDGWSMPVVFSELFSIYEALSESSTIMLNSPPKYQAFIEWQQAQDNTESQRFWTEYLKGFSAPTPITVKNSPAVVAQKELGDSGGADRYREMEISIRDEKLDVLQKLAKQHRLTLNHILQGVWGILLNRYSGEDSVLFGTTVSGRPAELPGVEQMVGCFINTLPLRLWIDNEQPFIDWLQASQEKQVEIKHFESSSLVDVQRCSQVPSKEALFESILVFENYPIDDSLESSQESMQIGSVEAFQQTNFPLTFICIPGKELVLRFSYDSYLFEEDTIDRMLKHVDTLLTAVAHDADTPVGKLPLISDIEASQVTSQWNQTFTKLPNEQTIGQLFEQQVILHGDRLACRFDGVDTTYLELNQLANQLANQLVAQGIDIDQPIAICLDRSREMLVGILAILKIGCAYMPIDPSYPKDRIAYMVENSQTPALITNNSHVERFTFLTTRERDSVPQLVNLDTAVEISDRPTSFADLRPTKGADGTGIIIYTSGSTGKPKGVCVSQLAVERMVLNTNYMQFDPSYRFGHGSNVSFDAVSFEFWGALLNGASLIGIDKDTMLTPQRFADFIKAEKINVQFITTALFNVMSKQVPEAFDGLQYVLFGGEACDPNQVAAIAARKSGPEHLLHMYGPSENATYSTYYEVESVLPGAGTVPIGYPVSNSTIYILDGNRQPVPIGVPGEIYVGGVGIATGYLYRPELTAEVFMDDPYCHQMNSRMYKTGDLGRLLSNGAMEILGRIDDQVKIRGFRIELGEIETAVNQLPSIADAVVVVREDQPGNKQLVAYCVLSDSSDGDLTQLRGALKQRLPDYMVPAALVVVDQLPITPNGKVDKKSLPTPSADAYQISEYVAARNDVEQALVDIWQEVLSLPQIGVHDDFFDLGGHSLLVTKVSSRIKEKLTVELPLRTLFEVPTITALAEIIGAVQWQNKPMDESVEEEWDDEEFEEGTL